MNKVKLYNRDHIDLYVEMYEGYGLFSLPTFSCRILKNNDGSIYAIDPPGGPFISVGSKIDDKEIKEIEFNKGICKFIFK